jgi:hypothetical protein
MQGDQLLPMQGILEEEEVAVALSQAATNEWCKAKAEEVAEQLTKVNEMIVHFNRQLETFDHIKSNQNIPETWVLKQPRNEALDPVPAYFPNTVADIMKLTKKTLVPIEDYYGVPHEGSLDRRRRKVAWLYGATVPMKYNAGRR